MLYLIFILTVSVAQIISLSAQNESLATEPWLKKYG